MQTQPSILRIFLGLFVVQVGIANGVAAPGAPMRQSKQFTVVDARPVSSFSPGQLKSVSGDNLVRLDADVLLLSAERVKDLLYSELNVPVEGATKIRLFLYPATRAEAVVGVISSLQVEGWQFRLEIPDQIEPEKLTRGLVHSLLLELANRGQTGKSAELPLWLVEGLTAHLSAIAGPDLVIGSVPLGKMLRIVRERRGLDYLKDARQTLRDNRPLSFAQLAYPSRESLEGPQLAVFRASAHLFVYELLRLKNGPAQLVSTLRELPKCWNWETALLRGFATEFHRMLDVEKKWSVDVLAFASHDPSQVWSRVVCLGRLDEVLSVPAAVRVAADMLPAKTTLTLQQVIANWDFPNQSSVLRQKLSLLEVLRYHSPEDVKPLIDEYHRSLMTYLQERDAAGRRTETRSQRAVSASAVAQSAIKDLDALDKRRDELRPERVLSANPL